MVPSSSLEVDGTMRPVLIVILRMGLQIASRGYLLISPLKWHHRTSSWPEKGGFSTLHVCQYHSYDIKSISNFERAELFVINWCIAFKHSQIESDWWEKIQQNSLISSTHPRWKGVFRLVRGDLFIWRRQWVAASLFMKGDRWSGLGMGRAIFRFYLEPQTVPRVRTSRVPYAISLLKSKWETKSFSPKGCSQSLRHFYVDYMICTCNLLLD